jgi:hypothetical protein
MAAVRLSGPLERTLNISYHTPKDQSLNIRRRETHKSVSNFMFPEPNYLSCQTSWLRHGSLTNILGRPWYNLLESTHGLFYLRYYFGVRRSPVQWSRLLDTALGHLTIWHCLHHQHSWRTFRIWYFSVSLGRELIC